MDLAEDRGNVEAAEALLPKGANENAENKNYPTPLHRAAANGKIELPLKVGDNIESKGKKGRRLIHWAAYWNEKEALEALIKAGAGKNAKDNNEKNATSFSYHEGKHRSYKHSLSERR